MGRCRAPRKARPLAFANPFPLPPPRPAQNKTKMIQSPRRGSFKVAAVGGFGESEGGKDDDEVLSVASDDTLNSSSGLMRRRQQQGDREFARPTSSSLKPPPQNPSLNLPSPLPERMQTA